MEVECINFIHFKVFQQAFLALNDITQFLQHGFKNNQEIVHIIAKSYLIVFYCNVVTQIYGSKNNTRLTCIIEIKLLYEKMKVTASIVTAVLIVLEKCVKFCGES